jgi:uncharacterized protein with LGFP repeats
MVGMHKASSTLRARVIGVVLAGVAAAAVCSAPASADTAYGEFTVGGKIEEAFDATGGVDTWGNPITPERVAFRNGRFQVFEKNVSFYWNAGVDNGTAHFVGGAIRNKWGSRGFERGVLGYPLSNELDVPGRGKRQDFQGGNIYWSSSSGAHTVWGKILGRWAQLGGSRGFYGMPQTDEYRVGGRFAQDFAGGTIFWP